MFKHSKWHGKVDNVINNSKKTLSEYFEIIDKNIEIEKAVPHDKKIWYNLFSSKAVLFPITARPDEPFDKEPINRNSEILVQIPHLEEKYFVKCNPSEVKKSASNSRLSRKNYLPIQGYPEKIKSI